jgi:hypothetical protein
MIYIINFIHSFIWYFFNFFINYFLYLRQSIIKLLTFNSLDPEIWCLDSLNCRIFVNTCIVYISYNYNCVFMIHYSHDLSLLYYVLWYFVNIVVLWILWYFVNICIIVIILWVVVYSYHSFNNVLLIKIGIKYQNFIFIRCFCG